MNREALYAIIDFFCFVFSEAGETTEENARHYVREKYFEIYIPAAEREQAEQFFTRRIAEYKQITDSANRKNRLKEICATINGSILYREKLVLLTNLLECQLLSRYLEVDAGINAALYLKIKFTDSEQITDYVFNEFLFRGKKSGIMIVDGVEGRKGNHFHMYFPGLSGRLLVLKLPYTDFLLVKSSGEKNFRVNGRVMEPHKIYHLSGSDVIHQHAVTIFYNEVIRTYIEESIEHRYTLAAENVSVQLGGNTVLRDVNLCEESGTLVGLMGASGAGKTTLLNVLCGNEPPSQGQVRINGADIYRDKISLQGVIGYISQDDLLLEELSVYQNLFFNAQLIFKNKSRDELEELTQRTLSNLGLAEIQQVKVGSPLNKKISGGQRKRLNIALELIREPEILFVDEPTSGLSSRDSDNVMELLKELSLRGKLVVVVIHQPTADIYKRFDKMIFLDTGGYQVYYGNPALAPGYFREAGNYLSAGSEGGYSDANPEVVFNILEEKKIGDNGEYSEERKIPPAKWHEEFRKKNTVSFAKELNEKPRVIFQLPNKLRQWVIFSKRDFLSKISNLQYVLINTLEAPALAAILAFVIRYKAKFNSDQYVFRENENLPAYLFMSVIVMLFLGMSVSAEEIFRDKRILKREKFLHLSRLSYLLSKSGILFLIFAIQAALFVLAGNAIMGVKGMFVPYFLMLFSTACAAGLLGLIISSTFNSVVTIYIIIPLLVIPQMILGGGMFSYDKLNSAIGGGAKVPVVADFTLSRWAYEGLAVHQFMNNNYDKNFYETDKKISALNYKMVYALPQLMQVAQDARNLHNAASDSLKQELDDKLLLLRKEIRKELALDSSLSFKLLNKMYRGLFTKYVADASVAFFNERVKHYTQQFLDADKEKNNIISSLIETAEDEKKFLRIKDQFSNDFLADVVKRSMCKNKTTIEDDELKQVVDAIYLDPEKSLISVDTHIYTPQKYFFGRTLKTFYFNLIFIWFISVLSFVVLYFDGLRKILNFFSRFTPKVRR